MAKDLSFGAARETRTLMGKPHLALNQACLPVSAWPQMPHIN